MRILIAHNYYQTPGGEDVVAQAEADLLKASGDEVTVYSRHNDELNRRGLFNRVAHLSSLGHNRTSYRQMRDLLRRFRPQVAHFHNIFYMMTPAVYRACHDEGVAVVQSLHNFRMMCANGLFFRNGHVCEDCLNLNVWQGVKHRCFRGSYPMTFAMASTLDQQWRRGTWLDDVDLYVAAAEFTRDKYIRRGIPSDKIVLKPHFVYPEPQPRQEAGRYALYLGRLSPEKGIDVLLEAWRSLKGSPLKVVGTGPLEDRLRQQVAREGLTNVEFKGFVEPKECENYLRQANFVVIPSVCYENFPRVVVEAFALGVPVVASRLGSLAELVQDGKTGRLFEAGNPHELTRTVRWCLDHPDEMQRMGVAARHEFEAKYSAAANYKSLIEIYRKAVARKETS